MLIDERSNGVEERVGAMMVLESPVVLSIVIDSCTFPVCWSKLNTYCVVLCVWNDTREILV